MPFMTASPAMGRQMTPGPVSPILGAAADPGAEGCMSPKSINLPRSQDNTILLAVPKKGRLHTQVMEILQGAGLDAKKPERVDVAMCKELPIKLVFLPAADIPQYVMEGDIDVGISGSDMLEETLASMGLGTGADDVKPSLKVIKELGIGKCKLCLQAPTDQCSLGAEAYVGKRIVTSFPALTKRYFDKQFPDKKGQTKIKVVSGSVEAAVGLGLADAIVDLVETGTTMRAAGLDIVSDVFSTQAVIMQQLPTEENGLADAKGELVDLLMRRIQGYLTSQSKVIMTFNCEKDNLDSCCAISPGTRSPTITKLQEAGWYSVSVLVEKKKIHTLMDQLTAAGASDIFCTSLINTRI